MYTALNCNDRSKIQGLVHDSFEPKREVECLVDLIPCWSLWREQGVAIKSLIRHLPREGMPRGV